MKKLALVFVASASLFSVAAMADTMVGFISDSHCGAKHDKATAANTQCVQECLKGGGDAVFVVDGKVLKFDADSAEKAKAFAGQDVKVEGAVKDDVVTVTSIEKK